MNRLAVVGHPVAHSLSPAMHTAAFAALGHRRATGATRRSTLTPEGFARRDRRAARARLRRRQRHRSPQARGLRDRRRALRRGRRDRRREHAQLRRRGDPRRQHRRERADRRAARRLRPGRRAALVLGAGGSARAVAWALDRAGAAVTIANRTEAKAVGLARELGVEALEGLGAGVGDRPRAVRSARQRDLGRPCKRGCGAPAAGARPKGSAPPGRSVG